MAGFIVLEDGRAYAASNWATDATLRAIAAAVPDPPLQAWLLSQQRGGGLTNVDLRELAPHCRPLVRTAIREAYRRIEEGGGVEDFAETEFADGWRQRFGELVEMVERFESGEPPEAFNPHMNELIPPSGARSGPGWDV